ncbi:uncharacterized protein LOC143856007 [Tasmannia lanceolata]|uniref:uncharacterized protein LOC143856007 n=1 Tax=Tasmannia lanceolata TaxID=3420 RepID=UPI004062BF8C
MIKVGCWNVRGICSRRRRKDIKSLMINEKLPFIGLLETKASKDNFEEYSSEIADSWSRYANYHHTDRDRIWILWNSALVNFTVHNDSLQHIHGDIEYIHSGIKISITIVYAKNSGIDRRHLWDDLRTIAPTINKPWLVVGDFNIVRFCDERYGGLRKLDRALVNEEWLCCYPLSLANFKNPGLSDHCPIIIQSLEANVHGSKPFKFHDMWLEDLSLYEVVDKAWAIKCKGNPLFKVTKKLKEVKRCIKIWNSDVFGRVDIQLPLAKKTLDSIQSRLKEDPKNLEVRTKEKKAAENYIQIANREESMFRQKARINWLNLGDSNSSFFHSAMKSRRNYNGIHALANFEGTISTNPDTIKATLIQYYENLLNKRRTDSDSTTPNPNRTLSSAQAANLSRHVTREEIEENIRCTEGSKAPGPDGFNKKIYKTFWYLIGDKVSDAISYFFRSGKMSYGLNSTFISLIPKSHEASSPDMFHYLYKIITKILASRLKGVMDDIISPHQSAFIKNRTIQDNILLAQNLVHNFHLKSKNPVMCLKMDIKIAFDNVNHQTHIQFMRKIGFNQTWCKWIEQCIETASFSVLLNGSPCGYFNSTNGVRQGDPLSPLLFCVCMEMLSVIIDEAASFNQIITPFSKGSLSITHLLFVDDVLLFAEASVLSAKGINDCFNRFMKCSGLEVNLNKSEVFFSEGDSRYKGAIKDTLSIPQGSLPIKYLVLPLITSRLSAADCAPLISKIHKRIASWSNRLLSRAGRVELTKSILNSFHPYWAASFHLLAGILDKIEKIFRDFIWAGPSLQKSYHPIGWDTICTPKAEGGLGLRKLKDLNKAADMKQIWSIIKKKNSLWVAWFHLKYPWHPDGPIVEQYPPDGEYLIAIRPQTSVHQVLRKGIWDPIMLQRLPSINLILEKALVISSAEDEAIWKDTIDGSFSLKSAWNGIREHHSKITWASSVWFKGHIPKMSFTACVRIWPGSRDLYYDDSILEGNQKESLWRKKNG